MSRALIIVRQHGLREISDAEVCAALDDAQMRAERKWVDVDMRPFAAEVEMGVWEPADLYLREQAGAVRKLADDLVDPQIHFFGLAEVSHVVTLGAYLGLERRVVVHEFDRDAGSWTWPSKGGSIHPTVSEVPAQAIPQRGTVPLLVNLSYPVSEADVAAAIGDETFPPVRIDLPGCGPGLGRVHSEHDLGAVRQAIRTAFSRIRRAYPNAECVHLFAAVPASVGFALGQEIVPRNAPPVQTYRYRADEQPKQKPAILVRGASSRVAPRVLAREERERAEEIRIEFWSAELEAIREHAARLGRGGTNDHWYDALFCADALARLTPFPRLASLCDLVPPKSTVARSAYGVQQEYHYAEGIWRIGDELALNLAEGCIDDAAHRLRIRLFLVHEHLHHHHMVTGDTAPGVGRFPNALEHVDYTSDFYGLCHELDRAAFTGEIDSGDEPAAVLWIRTAVEEVIKSFWAFESGTPRVWEIRRLRRHLNWYWQLARLVDARTVEEAMRTLVRKPIVEIAGLPTRVAGRRLEADLSQLPPQVELEIAVVLDDDSLDRRSGGGGTDPRRLCEAMVSRDHDGAKAYFRALERYARARVPRDG